MNFARLLTCFTLGMSTGAIASDLDQFHKLSVKDRIRYTLLDSKAKRRAFLSGIFPSVKQNPDTILDRSQNIIFSPLNWSALVSTTTLLLPPDLASMPLLNSDYILTGDPGWLQRKRDQPLPVAKSLLNPEEWKGLLKHIKSCSYSRASNCLGKSHPVRGYGYISAGMRATGSGAHGRFIEVTIVVQKSNLEAVAL